MKTINIRLIVASVALLFTAFNLFAQDSDVPIHESETRSSDFTPRFGAKLNFTLVNNLSLYVKEETRFKNDMSSFDRIYLDAGLDYKINPYFKAGVEYSFRSILQDGKISTDYEKYWEFLHRIGVPLIANIKSGNWKFSLREKPIVTFSAIGYNPLEKVNPAFALRSKFQVEYTAKSVPLKPFTYFEMSNTLNVPAYVGKNYIEKLRFCLGTEWYFDAKNSIELFYRFDINANMNVAVDYKDDITIKGVSITKEIGHAHILGIFYKFSM